MESSRYQEALPFCLVSFFSVTACPGRLSCGSYMARMAAKDGKNGSDRC